VLVLLLPIPVASVVAGRGIRYPCSAPTPFEAGTILLWRRVFSEHM